MAIRKMICITCPRGWHLEVDDETLQVLSLIHIVTGLDLDGWMGLAVAAFILWGGVGIVRETLNLSLIHIWSWSRPSR